MYRTRLTLKPGAPGTQRLVHEYGARLVCVRYRYDEVRQLRIKTVELIVEERPWVPHGRRYDPMDYVHLRVPYHDRARRIPIRRLGGTWDPSTSTWRLTYAAAKLLGLTRQIVSVPSTGE